MTAKYNKMAKSCDAMDAALDELNLPNKGRKGRERLDRLIGDYVDTVSEWMNESVNQLRDKFDKIADCSCIKGGPKHEKDCSKKRK